MSHRAGAIALIAAPIFGLAATLTLPELPADGAARLGVIEAESTRFLVANLLLLVSFTLFVLAVLALRGRLAERRSRWGAAAALAAAVGWVMHNAIVGMVMSQLPMARAEDRAGAGALSEALFEGVGFTAVLLPMLVLTEIGTILLVIALWRAGLAPLWASIVVILGLVSEFVAPTPFDGIALYALLTVGFGGIALRLLAMPQVPAPDALPSEAANA
ncbi:hypothetical protein [Cryobacterium sp. BB736]|uniref:hypothetical protein n=1 Tax=Cryobacterium sp. BB736 TaxID=2746963 RepID=UPI0018734B6A|nr:hypothetical protein [Cryobacterium sp. BB736]